MVRSVPPFIIIEIANILLIIVKNPQKCFALTSHVTYCTVGAPPALLHSVDRHPPDCSREMRKCIVGMQGCTTETASLTHSAAAGRMQLYRIRKTFGQFSLDHIITKPL